jgi:hypothetical protein
VPLQAAARERFGNELIVLPGIELAGSAAGNLPLLAIFPPDITADELAAWLESDLQLPPAVRFDSHGKPVPTPLEPDQLLAAIECKGGLAIAAPRPGGQSQAERKALREILGDTRLAGLDLSGRSLAAFRRDLPGVHELAIGARVADDRQRKHPLALVSFSGAREPGDLGRCYTYLKSDDIGFRPLCQGMRDPEVRLRLSNEADIDLTDPLGFLWGPVQPEHWLADLTIRAPRGGFLRDLRLAFNPNYNCLIGGRGAGKSSVIELIRYIWETQPLRKEDTNNFVNVFLPLEAEAILDVQTPRGRYRLVRRRDSPTQVHRIDDDGKLTRLEVRPHQLFSLAVYGQKEILYTSQDVRSQLDLLDRLVGPTNIDSLKGAASSLAIDLRPNGATILALTRQVHQAEMALEAQGAIEEQLAKYVHSGLSQLSEQKRLIDREEQAWAIASDQLQNLQNGVRDMRRRSDLELGFLGEKEVIGLPDRDLLLRLRDALERGTVDTARALDAVEATLSSCENNVRALRTEWEDRRQAFASRYREALSRVPGLTPETVLGLERQRAQLETTARLLTGTRAERKIVLQGRRVLLHRLTDNAEQQYRVRAAEALRLSKRLRRVYVDVQRGGDVDALLEFLHEHLRGSDLRSDDYRALACVARPNLARLLAYFERADPELPPEDWIYQEYLPDGFDGSLGELGRICGQREDRLRRLAGSLGLEKRLELDSYQVPDLVTIRIDISPPDQYAESRSDTLFTTSQGASAADREHDDWPILGQALGAGVSVGQGCTAILSMILLESKDPLLIDQPEDDLDNRFIFDGVVRTLRRMRGSRQILFATHNPNLPVGGDAEQIVALAAERDPELGPSQLRSRVVANGFIDVGQVRDQVKLVLEGGDAAFEQRRRRYGF